MGDSSASVQLLSSRVYMYLSIHRVGTEIMMHLLGETSIYVPVGNDCYSQLTGTALISLKPLITTSNATSRGAKKRASTAAEDSTRPPKKQKIESSKEPSKETSKEPRFVCPKLTIPSGLCHTSLDHQTR